MKSYTIEWKEFIEGFGKIRKLFISDMRGNNKKDVLESFKKDYPDAFAVKIRVNKELTDRLLDVG